MPETVIPPQAAPGTTTMGKPVPTTEYSWGGWAISSFTNKLSAANGDINTVANGVNAHPADPARSSSAPPARDRHGLPVSTLNPPAAPSTATASPLARHAVLSPTLPTPASSAADEADFDAWGEMHDPWNDATTQEDTFFDAVNSSHPALQPAKAAAAATATTGNNTSSFDDRGEPDFAGWLAAQSQSKVKTKGLPRGLVKTPLEQEAAKKSGLGIRSQSAVAGGGLGLKKDLAGKGLTKTAAPVPAPAKEKSWEEDGWGDGWS